MIQVYNKKFACCGCGLCETVCPQNAIEMQIDEVGFKYPKINQEKCIDCGACKKICGFNADNTNFIKNSYAAVNTNDKVLQKSASGGVFSAIAQSFFYSRGLVCGAEMLICGGHAEVRHILIETESELERLQGSKYVQSDVKDCFNEIILRLKEGKKVLFSGTPCQVAAIKKCVRGKLEENLFTIDIICHGVPSLKFFNDYLQVEKTKKKMDIQKYIFRDKQYGWGTKGSIRGIKKGNMITEPVNSRTSSYYSFFLDGEVYRDCCYECPFAQEKRIGDLTIGDYWGVEKYSPEVMKENGGDFSKKNGVSCLLVNTDKGKELLDCYGEYIQKIPVDIEKIKIINTQLNHPANHTHLRDRIFKVYARRGYNGVEKIYWKQLIIRKGKGSIKRALKKILPEKYIYFLKSLFIGGK